MCDKRIEELQIAMRELCGVLAVSCKNNSTVSGGDFKCPYIDMVSHNVKGLDGMQCVKYVQTNFLNQYIEGTTESTQHWISY